MVIHQRLSCVIPLCGILLMTGCNSETKTPQPAPQPTLLPPVDAQPSDQGAGSEVGRDDTVTDDIGERVSSEEAGQFARRWERAVQSGDAAAGAPMVDFDAIIDRTLAPFDLDDEFRRGFITGVKKTPPIEAIIQQLGKNEQDGGSYRLVKVASRGGQQHAIFRLLGSDGSLNYHDLRIVRQGDSLIADQFFVALSGEDLADTLRATVAPAINAHLSSLARPTVEAKRKLEELMEQKQMMNAVRSEEFAIALQIYQTLPEEAKRTKAVQLARLMAAMNLESDEYLQIIDEYGQRFPNDPSLPIVMIDAAVMREDVDQLEEARAALQVWTGGDSYLDLMIAGVLASLGQVARAEELTSGIDIDAIGIADAHDYALNVALVGKDHEATLNQLRKLRDEYGYHFSDLSTAEGFEEFVKSPSFQVWQSDQAN